jgi:UDP:flavonoid glycosyltransferase YjiC (YdhE family)
MKVLVTATPGLGHILPLVPLARELRRRGHDLRWVGGHGGLDEVEDQGIDVVRAGMPEAERQRELVRRYPELVSVPPPERQQFAFPKVFAELAASEMLDPVRSVVEEWRPDVIMHEAAELTAPLAAAAAGIPSVCHGFGEVVPEATVRAAGEVMAPLWRAAGLDADPYAGSYRGLYVDIYPPSLRSAGMAHVPRVQRCRPAHAEKASGGTVYVTFGTLFNQSGDGFRTAVLAAASVAEEVFVTLGHGRDPGQLGPVPDNVRVETFVAQAEVLPRCAAVVCHGGSGTVLASLAHGVPLVCLPQGADQFVNAANVVRLGAGRAVATPDATESALGAAIDHVLRSPGPKRAATMLAEEIASMPSRAETVRAIEEFVRAGR